MVRFSLFEHLARRGCLVAVVVVGVVATGTAIGLFADGSFFLLRILSSQGPFVANAERPFVTVLSQVPLLLALGLGVRGTDVLVTVHSAGLVLVPTVAWFGALWLQRRGDLFWLFAMMWSGVDLVTGFFAIGEYNPTYALAALAASMLLTDLDQARARPFALLVVSVVLLRSYESMLFLGPVLFALCVMRWRLTPGRAHPRGVAVTPLVLTSGALFLVGTVLALRSAGSPDNTGVVGTALNVGMLAHDPRLVLAAVGTLGLVLTLLLDRLRPLRALVTGATVLCAVPLGLVVLPVRWQQALPGWLQRSWPPSYDFYRARVAAGGLLLLLILVAGVMHLTTQSGPRPQTVGPRARGLAWIAPASVSAVLALLFVVNAVEFGRWADHYRDEVRARSGLVRFEDADIDSRYAWKWTNPSLSLVLQTDESQAVVLNPARYRGWQPFDPRAGVPRLGPDFRR